MGGLFRRELEYISTAKNIRLVERINISSPLNVDIVADYVSSLVSFLSNDKSKLMQSGYVREKAIHA